MLQQMVAPLVDLNTGAQESLASLDQLECAVADQAQESAQIESSVKSIGEKAINKVTVTTNELSNMAQGLTDQVSKLTLS
jgi:methyl-accepting chemotaxis protein